MCCISSFSFPSSFCIITAHLTLAFLSTKATDPKSHTWKKLRSSRSTHQSLHQLILFFWLWIWAQKKKKKHFQERQILLLRTSSRWHRETSSADSKAHENSCNTLTVLCRWVGYQCGLKLPHNWTVDIDVQWNAYPKCTPWTTMWVFQKASCASWGGGSCNLAFPHPDWLSLDFLKQAYYPASDVYMLEIWAKQRNPF